MNQMNVALPGIVLAVLTGGCTTLQVSEAIDDQSLSEQMSADARYMRQLAGTDKTQSSTRVDLADPAQYRFVMNRLAAADRTAASSPHLFERIQRLKDKAVARAAAGVTVNAVGTDLCAGFILLGTERRVGSTIVFDASRSVVSCQGANVFVYTDITASLSNQSGTENILIAAAAGEDVTGGRDLDTVAIVPAMPAQLGRVNRTDSLVIAFDDLGNEQVTFNQVRTDIVPIPGSIQLQHPTFHPFVANGGQITMCQLAGSDAECDYRVGKLVGDVFTPFAAPPTGIAAVNSVNPWLADTSTHVAFAAPFDPSHAYLPTVGTLDVGSPATGTCSIISIESAKFHLVKTISGGVCVTPSSFAASVVPTANPRTAVFQAASDFTSNVGNPPTVNCGFAQMVTETLKPSVAISARVSCGERNPNGSPRLRTRLLTLFPGDASPTAPPIRF